MASRPKISVALCTYNGEKFLAEQLESLAAQTLPPVEIVVCDDDSTDSTLSILDEFRKRSDIPIHIHRNSERLGVTRNFRKAIGLCSGDYIALCDQDDVWLKDKLEKEIAVFDKPGNETTEVVFSDLQLVDEKLNSLGKTMWQILRFNIKTKKEWNQGKALDILVRYGNQVTGASMLMKSSLKPFIDDILNKTHKLWIHDGLIALTAAKRNSIRFLDEATVLYRQHPAQVMGILSAPKVSLRTRLSKIWHQRLDVAQEVAFRLKFYRDHRQDLVNLGFTDEQLYSLDRVMAHYALRNDLPVKRTKRLPVILKEWLTLRYYKYSGSVIMQALKDWFVRRSLLLA